MTRLLDVNVLMALAWSNHSLRSAARGWLVAEMGKGELSLATCPITELGFSRVSMNIKGFAQDFGSSATLLKELTESGDFRHEFWSDSLSLLAVAGRARPGIGPAQLTDFYLAELALKNGGRLVTFDTGIKHPAVELISAS